MSLKESVMDPLDLRYKGLYDLDGIYKLIRQWLDDRRYDFMEKIYKDKAASPFGNEVEHDMVPELKVNEFIKFHIHIVTKFFDYKEFEAEIDGEKKMVSDGRFFIKLSAEIEFDYQNRFKSDFQKKLLKFLVKTLLVRYYEFKYYDKLTYDLYDLQAKLKKFIKMESEYNAY